MEAETNQINFITTTLSDILNKIGIFYHLEFQDGGEEKWFLIRTEDSALMYGDPSRAIVALNTILRRVVEKNFKEPLKFLIDINDHHKKHAEEIKDSARMHAQRVRYFKKDIEMRPMNAYERRIVHTVLQEYPDISTESIGDGLERRVVIKPLSL